MTPTDPYDTPEFRDLEKTKQIPMNRRTRRNLAKRAGVRFKEVNHVMRKPQPVYLGIKEIKRASDNKEFIRDYKHNAHESLKELHERRAAEVAAAAKITEGKTLSKKAMKKLKGAKSERNDRRDRRADA